MSNVYCYMRISTKEERSKQKFTRQEQALERWQKETGNEVLMTFKDDASGKSFDRPEWKKIDKIVQSGDTIVFKDICRFTRQCDEGLKKYMELMERGINLIFMDNMTLNTSYIRSMMAIAEKQENRIAKKTLENTIELLLLVELDRAEQEREITVRRIKDGIEASDKKSGRKPGQVDKLSPELKADIKMYLADRSIKAVTLMDKHHISRNTLKKYCELVKAEN